MPSMFGESTYNFCPHSILFHFLLDTKVKKKEKKKKKKKKKRTMLKRWPWPCPQELLLKISVCTIIIYFLENIIIPYRIFFLCVEMVIVTRYIVGPTKG